MVADFLTVRQAANRFNVTEKTIRKWIRNGRLAAELRDGANGPQYFVSGQVVEAVHQIVDVVQATVPPISRDATLELTRVVSEQIAPLMSQIALLQQSIDTLNSKVDGLQEALIAPRGHWWQFWRAPRNSALNTSRREEEYGGITLGSPGLPCGESQGGQ